MDGRSLDWIRLAAAAAAVGLLFGLHPVTVEPVAWVAERKTLLATFFALGCLVCYVGYARRRRRWLYVAALLLYALALLAKPTSTPLVAALLLLDCWPLRRLSWRVVLEKWPFLVIAAVGAVVTVVSQRKAAGLDAPTRYDPVRIMLTLCHNVVFYLYVLVWPVRLTWHYPFPEPLNLSQPMVAAGVVGTVALLVLLLLSWRWTRAALTSWLIFFVLIFPTMNVIGFTYVIAGLKFVYLPAAELLIGLDALGALVWKPASARSPGAGATTRRSDGGSAPGSVGHRARLGRRGVGVQVAAGVAVALLAGLGCLYHAQGNDQIALAHLRESVRLEPNDAVNRRNLGIVLFESGRTEEAIGQYREAVRLAPDDFRSWLNLGNAYFKLSDYAQGIAWYDQALRVRPDYDRGYYDRGLALARLGRLEEAIADYRKALEINPDYELARRQLEAALESLGRPAGP